MSQLVKALRGVRYFDQSHPQLQQLNQRYGQPSLHGDRLWDATALLLDYWQQYPLNPNDCLLEVGCGWGLSSIYAAQRGLPVLATDSDPVMMAYANATAKLNRQRLATECIALEQMDEDFLKQFDVLVAADICFWDGMSEPLVALVDRAMAAGVKQVLLADPERPPFLAAAMELSERYCASWMPWRSSWPHPARGCLLKIEAG